MPAWETKPQSLHSSNSPSSTRKAFSSERGSAKALLKASAAACVLCEFDCSEYVLGVCDVVFENDWCLELMSLVAVSIFARIMININQSCTCRSTFKHWFLCKPVLQDSRRLCVLYHTVASGQSMPACGTQSSMSTSRLATELPLLWVYDRPGVMKAERLTRHISKFYNRTNTGGSPVSGPTIEHFQEIHPKSDRLKQIIHTLFPLQATKKRLDFVGSLRSVTFIGIIPDPSDLYRLDFPHSCNHPKRMQH